MKKTIYLKREEATLIRRTSSNLHIYFKLLFIILRKIELRLEKSLKRFPLGRWDSRRNHTKLNGWLFARPRGEWVWVLDTSLCLTKPFFANGVGNVHPKRKCSRSKLYVIDMGREKGGDTLVKWEMHMGSGLWKVIRKEWDLFNSLIFLWVMGEGWSFGKTKCVVRNFCVYPSLLCML